MSTNIRVALYARYSSDLQRDESITAQVRVMEDECTKKGYKIVGRYLDRAKSARSDNRPEFQRMIADARKGKFDVIMVHKLNRFSRNMADAYKYKTELRHHCVRLESIVEKIDDSPQGVIMEALFFAMAENYSRELATEVLKGQKENAYQCRHTGGSPPLGFDVDASNKKLIINENEADTVKRIFNLYSQGHSYVEIIDSLNKLGRKTKKGRTFGKNSISEILRNEKYVGNYVYNKKAGQNSYGKRNNHSLKDSSEVIRIEGGCPAIVSKEIWDSVQSRLNSKKYTGGRTNAKEIYLLGGVIRCGKCGKLMTGNRTTSNGGKKLYVSYRCENNQCDNPQIKREWIEDFVLRELQRIVFNESQIPFLLDKMQELKGQYEEDNTDEISSIERQLKSVDLKVSNIINSIADGISQDYFVDKLSELEGEKAELTSQLQSAKAVSSTNIISLMDENTIRELFAKYREFISTHNIPECKKFISTYVNSVTVYPDDVRVMLNVPSVYQENQLLALPTSIDVNHLKTPHKPNMVLRVGNQTHQVKALSDIRNELKKHRA